jgi:hypothetical protein
MKTLKFVAYLFYRYYSIGPRARIPYFSTLCSLVLLLYIHLTQVLLIFNATSVVPVDGSQAKIGNWLKMALFLLPFFLFVRLLVKQEELKKLSYNENKVKRGYIFLIIYIVASFTIMIIIALYKKGKP